MQITKTEAACWIWASALLSFVLVLVIRAQEPKIVRNLRYDPKARQQLQAVAEELIKRSKTSGKKDWRSGEPDFPAEAKAMGAKKCRVSTFGEGVPVLKLPLNSGKAIFVFPKSFGKMTPSKEAIHDGSALGDGITYEKDFDETQIVTIDATGGSVP